MEWGCSIGGIIKVRPPAGGRASFEEEGGGASVENRRAECGAVGVGRHERGGEARRRWACSGWQTGQSLGGVRARGARSGRGGGVARGKWVCMCVDIEFTT